MEVVLKNNLMMFCNEIAPDGSFVFMDPKEVIFEECIKMNCFYCGKYGRNWRCPPNLPDINYIRMFSEYDEGMFVSFEYDVTNKTQFDSIRTESSIALHKTLLQLEKWFYNNNRATAISFIAGSCKLCKGGCGKDRCNNPYMSRSPLEATGVNIVKTAAKFGIDISFPTENSLKRLGLIMWQEPDYNWKEK